MAIAECENDRRCQDGLTRYAEVLVEKDIASDCRRVLFRMERLYGHIDFRDKTVLDIGGGNGIHSLYAACCGAAEVVCLEPEDSGSSDGVIRQFEELDSMLSCTNVRIQATPLQEFDARAQQFDVVILHDSINHLDEDACLDLLRDSNARNVYRNLFSKIYALCTEGADIVVSDCSRHNLYPLLRINNPFDPGIEWGKHQAPSTWAGIMREVGFVSPTIRWSTPTRFGHWGSVLFGNRIIAYCFTSHFSLRMKRPD